MKPCLLVLLLPLMPALAAGQGALSSLRGSSGDAGAPVVVSAPRVATSVELGAGECPADMPGAAAKTALLREKTLEAVAAVENRLPVLNRSMSSDIMRLLRAGRVRVACAASAGTHGGLTEHAADGSADITIYMGAGGVQYPLAARIFHELIHAADPAGRYMLSAAMHARAGFPDPVYGCQFAVFGGVGTDEIDRINNYESANGITIPELASYPCEGGRECPFLRKYAHLCHTGRPLASDATLTAAARQRGVECVVEGMLNNCSAPACEELRARVETSMEESGGRMTSSLRAELRATGGRLYDAGREEARPSTLPEEDRALYQAAFRAGFLRRTGANSCLTGR